MKNKNQKFVAEIKSFRGLNNPEQARKPAGQPTYLLPDWVT